MLGHELEEEEDTRLTSGPGLSATGERGTARAHCRAGRGRSWAGSLLGRRGEESKPIRESEGEEKVAAGKRATREKLGRWAVRAESIEGKRKQ